MTNRKLTAEIARLRADPDVIHHQRNRMLASMLECLNNEGLEAFFYHTHDLLACIILTFRHSGLDFPQIEETIHQITARYKAIVERKAAGL